MEVTMWATHHYYGSVIIGFDRHLRAGKYTHLYTNQVFKHGRNLLYWEKLWQHEQEPIKNTTSPSLALSRIHTGGIRSSTEALKYKCVQAPAAASGSVRVWQSVGGASLGNAAGRERRILLLHPTQGNRPSCSGHRADRPESAAVKSLTDWFHPEAHITGGWAQEPPRGEVAGIYIAILTLMRHKHR